MAETASDKAASQRNVRLALIPRPSLRSVTYFLVSLIILLVIFGFAVYVAGVNIDKTERTDVADRLIPYGFAIHTELSNRIGVVSTISAFTRAQENRDEFSPEFAAFGAKLYNPDLGVRNFQILTGTITKYVYPLEGNAQMIGMDWMKASGSNLKYLKEAISSKRPAIIGPFEAHKGAWVISAVDPIYEPDGSFYGLAAAVYDYKTVLDGSGLDRSKSTMDLAVRNKDKTTVYGKTAVFNSNPVIKNVQVGGSYWQLAAIPKGGWAAKRNSRLTPMILASGVIALLIAGLIAILADRQRHMRKMVYERTKELNASNKELNQINRLYSMLSKINENIVRADKAVDLLSESCAIIIKEGGFRMCWVGLIDKESKSVVPAATAGVVEDYFFDELKTIVPYDDAQSPKNQALLAKKNFVCNDVDKDPEMAPWRDLLRHLGYKSEASFPLVEGEDLIGALSVYSKDVGVFKADEVRLLEEVSKDISFALNSFAKEKQKREAEQELEKSYIAIKRTLDGTVEAIAAVAEHKDPYTAGHERRVVDLSLAIGKELNMDDSALEGLRTVAMLHDVGKTFIPAEILHKPGKLSDLEFSMIKAHPGYGYEVLSSIEFPWPIADIALQHHERIDGSGYPKGLKGKDIRFEAKIIAVADVIEAMASDRPYRPALPLQEALDELKKGRGRLYDEKVADAALAVFKKGYKLSL